jgi:hypothetical protein
VSFPAFVFLGLVEPPHGSDYADRTSGFMGFIPQNSIDRRLRMKKVPLAGLALCLLIVLGLAHPLKAQEIVITDPPEGGGGGGGCCLPPATTFGGIWTYATGDSETSKHPQAKLQPQKVAGVDTVARWLSSLKVYNGRLYAGYGDYDKNGTSALGPNGQLAITPFDPSVGFAATPVFEMRAEALPLYRILYGRLFAVINDASDNNVLRNYATDSIGSTWSEVDKVEADHVFDIAYTERFHTTCQCTPEGVCTVYGYTGDIWLVGSRINDAVIWHSEDGGQHFSVYKTMTPLYDSGLTHSRFYFAGVIQNKLYVQPYDFAVSSNPNNANQKLRNISYVVDGDDLTWRKGPDLFPRRGAQGDKGYQPQVFNNQLVYQTYPSTEGSIRKLRAFTPGAVFPTYVQGTVTDIDLPASVSNFTIDGQYLYVLLLDGSVARTTDLTLPWSQWETYPPFMELDTDDEVPPIRAAGRSIAVLNGVLYVGTTQAQIWKLSPW